MKLSLILMILIFLMPLVSADITVNDLLQEKYNLGDKIATSGRIITNDNYKGFLNYNLICPDMQKPLSPLSVSITGQEAYTFSEERQILEGNGLCFIELSLNQETVKTNNFTITKELDADFSISDSSVKLGEELKITGSVFKLNGVNVNGLATITLKVDGTPYIIDAKDIINGDFEYTNTLSSLPAGHYIVDVYVKDLYNNERLFENITSFDVSNQLNVIGSISKLDAKPGDVITLEGEVRDAEDNPVSNDVNAYVEVNGQDRRDLTITNGKFKTKVTLKTDTRSGNNKIQVIAEDKFGNIGEESFFVAVEAIPTKLEIKTPSEAGNPGKELSISLILYDQANDEINGKSAKLKIKDSENDKIIEEAVLSGDAFKLNLLNSAKPGQWNVNAELAGLKQSATFNVNELKKLDIKLNGQILSLYNDGNVKYEESLELNFNGLKISEDINLKPMQTEDLELYDEIDGGVYELKVYSDGQELNFGNVTVNDQRTAFGKITGAVVGGADGKLWIIILAVLIIILLLLYFFKFKGSRAHSDNPYARERDFDLAQGRLKRIREERERRKGKKRFFQGPAMKDEDVKDFRESVLKTIKDDEKRKQEGNNLFRNRGNQ